MGLSITLKKQQRLFLDDLIMEVSIVRGQIKVHFFGDPPFPFDVKRESVEQYKSRMNSGGNSVSISERKVCSLHKIKK